MNLSPAEAVAVIYPEIVNLVEQEVAKEIQAIAPKAIVYLQNCEKTHPGFLNIKADIDGTLVDIFEGALAWANTINPPAAATAEASAKPAVENTSSANGQETASAAPTNNEEGD